METEVVTENPWAASHEKTQRSKLLMVGGGVVVLLAIAAFIVVTSFVGIASASGGCGGG